MAEGNIRHQLLEGMDSSRDTVSLWGQMKTSAITRYVWAEDEKLPQNVLLFAHVCGKIFFDPQFISVIFMIHSLISLFCHLFVFRMTPVAKRAERKVWH